MGRASPATVLIVEDDEGLARLQQLRLERAGYVVAVAVSAAEGLARVRQGGVDLVVLDQNLPGGANGLELYRQLKDAGYAVPAILVTALNDETIVLRALRAGVNDFLPKTPDYLDYLLPAVERVLKERRVERQLAESQALLAGVIASALDAVLTVDEAGNVALFNPAAEQTFRCPAAEALGSPASRFLPGWPGPAEVADPWRAPSFRWDTEGVRADGERVPLEVAVSRAEVHGDRWWTCIARDVTERRRAEEDRVRLVREQMARAEAERIEADLRESHRRKDEFLATLAHELRNPLAPIRNALAVLRLTGNDPRRRDEARAMMERQVRQMVRLIDDLLDISRITRGKIELRRERVALAEVVRGAVESSRPLIDLAGHTLTVTLPPEPVILDADPTRLAQVLLNLLNNAAKYTEPGGQVWLTVEVVASGQWLVAREDKAAAPLATSHQPLATLEIRVRDTGVGIPKEMLPQVFEMFTQVDRSLERAQGGLGIGLSLVRGLVRLHGGTVEARSEGPGRGSEFVIRLPLPPQVTAEGQPAPAAAPVGPNGAAAPRRVLVVDDNRDAAQSLTRLLDLLGYETRAANDGPAALAEAARFLPDVVLLDIGMPGMSGYEVARRLRRLPGGSRTLLVAMTGWGAAADRRRSHEAGIDYHLVKPVDLAGLQELLTEHADPAHSAP